MHESGVEQTDIGVTTWKQRLEVTGGQAEPQNHLQLKARCQETEHAVASF